MTSQTDADRTARNIQLVQAGYDAFTSGDLATLETLFDPEVVWHAQRLGALSGVHKGWPELLRFFGGTMEMSRGTFRVTVTDRYANPGGVACMVRSQAERDGRLLDDRQMHVYRLDGDQVVEVWQFVGDGRAVGLPGDPTRIGPGSASPAGGAAGRPVAGHRPGQGPPTRGGDAGLPAGHRAGPHPAVA